MDLTRTLTIPTTTTSTSTSLMWNKDVSGGMDVAAGGNNCWRPGSKLNSRSLRIVSACILDWGLVQVWGQHPQSIRRAETRLGPLQFANNCLYDLIKSKRLTIYCSPLKLDFRGHGRMRMMAGTWVWTRTKMRMIVMFFKWPK